MANLHGFIREEEVISITHLPSLKKPVLMIGNQYAAKKVASFDSEESAEEFVRWLERWFGTDDRNRSEVKE